MIVDIKVPSPGESISEVEIANWLVEDGDYVEKDQEIAEIESDKATLPLIAEYAGKVQLIAQAEAPIKVGEVAAKIDTEAEGAPKEKTAGSTTEAETAAADAKQQKESEQTEQQEKQVASDSGSEQSINQDSPYKNVKISPLAEKLMQEKGMDINDVIKGLHRISRGDVEAVSELPDEKPPANAMRKDAPSEQKQDEGSRLTKTSRMSSLRRKLSQRLVAVKNETAMLTTFNEVDMSAVMQMRKAYKQQFMEIHGNKLGFMSFFTKAVTVALGEYPDVGAIIDGDNIVTHNYADVGIAVQTPKGLMVPIIRNAESKSIAELEARVAELAKRAGDNKITIEEMTGGNFTITNGGTFGSMLSTPILNPPQTAILGMHNITERPVAVDGKVEIRPMMYLAVSYDHRVLDGATSVRFLVKIKEMIENPSRMLFDGRSPEEQLLGL